MDKDSEWYVGGGEGILVWTVKSAWIGIEQLSACAYLQCALQHIACSKPFTKSTPSEDNGFDMHMSLNYKQGHP